MKQDKDAVSVAFITLLVYFLTVLPQTRPLINSLFILYVFVAGIGILYWPFARRSIEKTPAQSIYFLAIFMCVLLWIGVTGWFFSPFFYLLYLLAIVLAFMFSSFATLLFVMVLLGLFIPNVGSIDVTVDIITIVSLLSVVPLTYILQKEYLQLKQTEKKVLILEERSKELRNKVDEMMMNKIVKFAVNLRQPVNDIRQVALVAIHSRRKKNAEAALHKIAVLGQESLDQIERFEENVTGKKLLHTRNNSIKKKATKKRKKK